MRAYYTSEGSGKKSKKGKGKKSKSRELQEDDESRGGFV